MAEKTVLVLVRRSPLQTTRGAEALRMAVGLHLAENAATVALLDAAAWLATGLRPEIVGSEGVRKHLEMIVALGGRVVVEEESLAAMGIDRSRLLAGIEVLPAAAIVDLISDSDVSFSF